MSNQAQTNPQNATVSDEIIVRDAEGKFKVLRHGVLEDWTSGVVKHVPQERMPVRVLASPPVPQAPQPSVSAALGKKTPTSPARFYFDVRDEEEIERFRDKGGAGFSRAINEIAQKKAFEIIGKAGLAPDEEIKPRLLRAIVSRLKDVRDLIETKEVLLRTRPLGGVNLSNVDANKVLRLTEEYRAQFEVFINEVKAGMATPASPAISAGQQKSAADAAPRTPVPSLVAKKPAAAPLEIDITPLSPPERPFVHPSYQGGGSGSVAAGVLPADKQPEAVQKFGSSEQARKDVGDEAVKRDTPPPAPLPPSPAESVPGIDPLRPDVSKMKSIPISAIPVSIRSLATGGSSIEHGEKQDETVVVNPSAKSAVSAFNLQPSGPAGKSQINDVRPSVRIMGPVDELRYMSLEDLRRLSPRPVDAADKIAEKIDLLADESLLKRNEGMTGWKSSPLYQMYIRLGKESMDKGMAVGKVIEEMQKKGAVTLTPEEFEAIADLNQKLAY